jgi:hypothetical protein
MSRNFELLQEAGESTSDAPGAGGRTQSGSSGATFSGTPAMEIEGKAREEVLKLVRPLFLSFGAQGPPRWYSPALQELQAARTTVLGAVLNQRTFPIPNSIYRRL